MSDNPYEKQVVEEKDKIPPGMTYCCKAGKSLWPVMAEDGDKRYNVGGVPICGKCLQPRGEFRIRRMKGLPDGAEAAGFTEMDWSTMVEKGRGAPFWFVREGGAWRPQ